MNSHTLLRKKVDKAADHVIMFFFLTGQYLSDTTYTVAAKPSTLSSPIN
jgi:hypothetical protein